MATRQVSVTMQPLNQPLQGYKFPQRSFGKKNIQRSCRSDWFKSWSWLHYVEDNDTVLCHLCMRAAKEGKIKTGGTNEPAFVSNIHNIPTQG